MFKQLNFNQGNESCVSIDTQGVEGGGGLDATYLAYWQELHVGSPGSTWALVVKASMVAG